ncbi:NAD(P)-binding domain-containing protein [Porticoccaceae bacterium]|nr:NAD(P)-binding domain-containing protein [Porticoccaceae bacterium]
MGTKVAFVGLGVMGFPMAGWLSKRGYSVSVYNRTHKTAETWLQQYSGALKPTPADVAKDADIVFICVGNDDDVAAVTFGKDGVFSGMSAGAVLVDHTTTSAKLAHQLAAEAKRNKVGFVDAPVSGGQQGAENGQLTVMCGGQELDFLRVIEAINSYAKAVNLMGPAGSGQLCKMVNQICIAGLVQGLAEGLNFAERAGLNAHQVVEVISKPIRQKNGVYLVHVLDVEPATVRDFELVRNEIATEIKSRARDRALKNELVRLKQTANIEVNTLMVDQLIITVN